MISFRFDNLLVADYEHRSEDTLFRYRKKPSNIYASYWASEFQPPTRFCNNMVAVNHGTQPRHPTRYVLRNLMKKLHKLYVFALNPKHRSLPTVPETSLEGQVQAVNGGICIDLSQMDAVLEVNTEDMDCRVQAGVTRRQLNQYLRDTGLFFPIDPGADTSIGGMAATRASGTNAVRYGTMRENVLALTVVTASGEIIKTGTRARKSAAGYDLTRLFVGSEGTLGIMTEITLRLYGLAEVISAAIVSFPDVRSATDATIQTIQMGIPVARIELVDQGYMKAINSYSKNRLPGTRYPVSRISWN